MYNAHRGMMPQHQLQTTSRLTNLLESIKEEFDSQIRNAGSDGEQRDHYLREQINEITDMRRKLYTLEQDHVNLKETYERKINDLQRELDSVRSGQGHHSHHPPPQHHGSQQPAPPSLGQDSKNLFGGIMGGGAHGPSALGPPPSEPSQPQGLPPHLTQNSGLNTGPQPQQHTPYGSYNPGPTLNGYQHQPPQQPGSQHPASPKRGNRGTPQSHPAQYPGSPRSHIPTPPPGSHRQQQQQQQQPPPQQQQQQQQPQQQQQQPQQQHQQLPGPPSAPQTSAAPPYQHNAHIPDVGNALSELSVDELPPHLKRLGIPPNDDWFAIFNPKVQRVLDIELVQTLTHSSVVCCVRFSPDGRYVATGCNRAAQIFDVNTGVRVAHLEDETPENSGSDLYIRSVCFSPDGKLLATGAEDQQIRVWDIAEGKIKATFVGHEQDIYSLDFSRNGKHIASGSGDKTVRLWDLESKNCILNLTIEDGVTTCALSGDGRLIAAGSLDKSVRVWDVETGARLELLDAESDGHLDSVYSVAFSPNDRELVSASLDKTIKLWSLTPGASSNGANGTANGAPRGGQGRCIRTFEGHADFVLSVAFTTPDAAWVLSGSKDRGVQFWNPKTGEAQLHLQGHRNSVISVAPSPTGPFFATGSGDQKARIWSFKPYQG